MYRPESAIFDSIEKIIDLSKQMGLGDELYAAAGEELTTLGLRLGLGTNHIQTILFCHILAGKDSSPISAAEIAAELKCSSIRMLQYAAEFDVLRERRLIRTIIKKETQTYFVPAEVITALRTNQDYRPETHENISIEDLFDILDTLFAEKESHTRTFYELAFEIKTILDHNRQLLFVQKVRELKLKAEDLILFMYFCRAKINSSPGRVHLYEINDICEDFLVTSRLKRSLLNDENILCKNGLIVHGNDQSYRNKEVFTLSNKAAKEFLGEMKTAHRVSKTQSGLFSHKRIQPKELFYNEKEQRQIETLACLLKEDTFRQVRSRLSESGMRTGFACLFSGAPGTGKTETARQLARRTGRDIMEVDISETKSMWFGQSEKKVKEIFDRYSSLVLRCEKSKNHLTPILLFNEADGVIGKRMELCAEGRSASIDKTLNAMQNIILQEFENLKGILIAATNLVTNLDPAFDRRFLYKIEFGKPAAEARRNIWRTMIPSLCIHDAAELAHSFDFSGGQIENIARKRAIDMVLNGKEPGLERLAELCREEIMVKNEGRQIGFIPP